LTIDVAGLCESVRICHLDSQNGLPAPHTAVLAQVPCLNISAAICFSRVLGIIFELI